MVAERVLELAAEIAGRRLRGARHRGLFAHAPVELGSAETDLVEMIGAVDVDPHRHPGDAGRGQPRRRQVGGGVGDHRDAATGADRATLRVHVVGLGRADRAESGQRLEQRRRHIEMQVHA